MTLQVPLFPLNTVLFPRMVLPLHIFEDRYKAMVNYCTEHDSPFGVALIRSGEEVGQAAEPVAIGTTAHILRVMDLEEGRKLVVAQGRERFAIRRMLAGEPYLVAEVEPMPLDEMAEDSALVVGVELAFYRYLRLLKLAQGVSISISNLPEDAAGIAWMVAWGLQIDLSQKQELLATPALGDILHREQTMLEQENRIMAVLASEQTMRRKPPESLGHISLN
jgi:Lon protease-like protein